MKLPDYFSIDSRRLRAARALIANVEKSVAMRMAKREPKAPRPGYDELSDPLFCGVMLLAVVVLVVDLSEGDAGSVQLGWIKALLAYVPLLGGGA